MALQLPNDGCQYKSPIVLKKSKDLEFPQYKVWRPPSYTLLHLNTLPHQDFYKEFEFIERTLHFGEYVAERFAESLRTTLVTERSHTHLSSHSPPIQGLWFGPVIPENEDENNWYGNVSVEFDFQSLLENHDDLKFYFVEVVEYRYSVASRILISNKKYNLPLYDPTRKGGPWYRDENGVDKYLCWSRTLDDCIQNANNGMKHKLELILDVGNLPLSGDFGPSRIKVANHSEANSGKCKCKQFRSGPREFWKTCTSPWSKEKTLRNLQEIEQMIQQEDEEEEDEDRR